ncbi:hypothetical protein HMSSN036_65830 [Paenibacillus macerans]|nr:hypothetical protein HMSSN036_65830 [Paenibacillus macerans]
MLGSRISFKRRYAETARLFLLESEYQHAVLEAEIGWIQSIIADIEARRLTWSMEELRKRNESIDDRLDEKETE